NGLTSMNGLMTTSAGRKTVSYLVKCALAANDSLVKADQNNVNYTFAGGLGLCPQWKNGGVSTDATCQELVSACMMAHVNTAGVPVPLWLDAQTPAIGWGIDKVNFPFQEGSFFGNIIATGSLSGQGHPTATAPLAYYCDGAGFAGGSAGVVAGRLGASQQSSPYMNPFGTGTLCKNSSGVVAQYSYGVGGQSDPDGYKALTASGTPWNNTITVWRNNSYNPIFDTSYQSPGCLDAGAGTNATSVVLNGCNGSSSQSWSITPDVQTGNFFVKAAN